MANPRSTFFVCQTLPVILLPHTIPHITRNHTQQLVDASAVHFHRVRSVIYVFFVHIPCYLCAPKPNLKDLSDFPNSSSGPIFQ
ncbi:hypothetical protein BDZ94DRAFT_1255016 [Collybia nuda]|uniref:Uncharacterized protein n=1 Tax=Collybia nuda TaxID=64659 RepID=A0A9P5YAT8_9AGAR|nr:hypothetical protein BDZ94DRAFT_1255016 [Collybia nuda]